MLFNEIFARHLIEKGILPKEKVETALMRADKANFPVYSELVRDGADEDVIYRTLAGFLGIPFRNFPLTEVSMKLVSKFPKEKLIEYQVVPHEEREHEISFAVSNPFRMEELKEFEVSLGKKATCFLVSPSKMDELIRYIDNKIQQESVLKDFGQDEARRQEEEADEENVSIDAPVIVLCDAILKDAVSREASDIHIEPFADEVIIRYRIDGELTVVNQIPPHLYPSVLARYKIIAEMNIAERRVPQDGKISMQINEEKYDFRVSTIPTIHGEKLVIRIYNISLSTSDFASLGLEEKQQKLVIEMIGRPHGILLLTGPTGSGKSTSLYAFLRYLNKESTNIITVEDPVENQIDRINQIQVNPKANLTFATALRSILRQDPNVIMIGEIRDEETAQIAIRAAITGHLVLSTIHTNDAAGVVSRLINMGIPPYLVADSLLGAISQRLVRKLCPECKKADETTPAEMELLGLSKPHKIYRQCGCRSCNHTGYSGRIGVFEILVCNEEIRGVIMNPAHTTEMLNQKLKKKMPTILEHAKKRVLSGETSMEEYDKLYEIVKV